MSGRIPGMPGAAAHVLSAVLALVLTLCVMLAGVGGVLSAVTGSVALHESVALAAPVLSAQRARIDGKVAALAERYGFDPATVNALVTDEALRAYNQEAIAWWMGLLGQEPELLAPAWPTQELTDAVMADPLFQESTPSGRRRSVARDSVAAGVAQAIQESVLPLRTSLISLALSQVLPRVDVPRYVACVRYLPWAAAAAAAVCAALMALAMAKRPVRCLAYLGGGLAAGGLCLLLAAAAAAAFDLPGRIAEVSSILSLLAEALLAHLGLGLGIGAGICLAVGLGLMGVHQHAMTKLRRGLCKAGVSA